MVTDFDHFIVCVLKSEKKNIGCVKWEELWGLKTVIGSKILANILGRWKSRKRKTVIRYDDFFSHLKTSFGSIMLLEMDNFFNLKKKLRLLVVDYWLPH